MNSQNYLVGLLAETSLHPGSGQTTGVIDLPIMREAHTDWPCVYGSAVKGALRARAEERMSNKDLLKEIFGPDTANASDYAGALLVGDARLLLLPVRSLTSFFKYVTCPALLHRYKADRKRMGLTWPDTATIPPCDDFNVVTHADADADTKAPLFLEEFQLTEQKRNMAGLIELVAQLMKRDDAVKVLQEQLAVVSNDMFSHLARHATPVNAHVCIDNMRKTVKPGALWYEETLPPDTLLYVCLVLNDSRKAGGNGKLQAMKDALEQQLFPEGNAYLQLGGNETVGMGWCKVGLLPA